MRAQRRSSSSRHHHVGRGRAGVVGKTPSRAPATESTDKGKLFACTNTFCFFSPWGGRGSLSAGRGFDINRIFYCRVDNRRASEKKRSWAGTGSYRYEGRWKNRRASPYPYRRFLIPRLPTGHACEASRHANASGTKNN